MDFDHNYTDIDFDELKQCDWNYLYREVEEVIPGNTPEPHGKGVGFRIYLDSEHDGDNNTRPS